MFQFETPGFRLFVNRPVSRYAEDLGMMKIKLLLFSCLFLSMAACQSKPKNDFAQLKTGMFKNEVLGIMGSPQRTQRWHGMDRWTYIYFDDSDRNEKEVHFAEGRATYVGASYAPPVSAEQQDRIFETQNLEIEKQFALQREEARKARQYFPAYEDDVRGTNEIRYVPSYEPLQ